MPDQDLLDPSLSLSDSLTPNAQFIPDSSGTYRRIVFLGDEKARLERYLSQSIARTILDYEQVWRKHDRNKRAYEALSNDGEAITLPMCRANTNQQHAWLIDTLFSRDPWMGCDPLGNRKYTIVHKNSDTKVYEEKEVSATDEAKAIRALINYKWTHRLSMRRTISDWFMEGLIDGNLPSIVKLIHDDQFYSRNITQYAAPTTQTQIATPPTPPPSFASTASGENVVGAENASDTSDMRGDAQGSDNITPFAPASASMSASASRSVQIVNSTERLRHRGESVRIITIPPANFIKPFSSMSIDESPWCAHICEEPIYETHRKLSIGRQRGKGGYDFCLPDNEPIPDDLIASVMSGESTADAPNKKAKRSVEEVTKQREIDPLNTNIIYETYFRWPILTEEALAANPDNPTIEWIECCSDFHLQSKHLLNCWELGNWNGERPFVDFFMRPRPNSYSGTSTVEDIAPFQRYASQLFHLHVQNLVMRNVSVFFVRKGSSAQTSLQNRKLRPGMTILFDDPEDVQSKPLGTPIESVASEIQFLRAGAQEMSLVTQYDAGTADLARVTAGAFSQQQDLAKMQPQQVYDNGGDAIARLALKYIQMLIQYAPEQEIPQFDGVSDAIIDNILHLPREMVVSGDFAIYPVATPRDETKQAESQRDMQIAMAIDKANQFLIEMWGSIAKQGTPPPFVIVGLRAIARTEKILGELISHTRHDADDYVIQQSELMELVHQLYEMMQKLAEQQQQQQAVGQEQQDGQEQEQSGGQPPAPASAAPAIPLGGPLTGPVPQQAENGGGPPIPPTGPPPPPPTALPPPPPPPQTIGAV